MQFSPAQLKKLPSKAREKAIKLGERSEYHLGAARQVYAQKDDLHKRANDIVIERSEFIARLGGQKLSADAEKGFNERKAAVSVQIKQLADEIPKFRDAWEEFDNLLRKCAAVIDDHSGPFEPAKPATRPRSIEAARERIAALKKQHADVSIAPIPRDQYIAAAKVALDKAAKTGETFFDPRVHSGDPFRLASVINNDGRASGIGAGALLLAIFRDEVLAKLEAMIPPDSPDTLTEEQRAKKLAKIEADLLQAEREEEAFIEAADADGWRIARRSDANPLAILGIEA
ncbi:hypothetical protein [Agrobacterium genomosp. 13]|uniref:Uncharacterized protein n=1 Tax=Agrobacterium genomosp. 13 str. CFBP 6927 TaxID=1183428 RepID=A0ABM9VFP0_9HYPH|nr:hypothetical protein [Agrobacterium genomosp. 13]CUX31903.1 conserved hypothetical protein [Agrobacterium genomosp. 13 str. CFBP 6927]